MAISVLVATYNRDRLLQECLAQLARQAFEPRDEMVVIDNGSRDGTRAVVNAAASGFPVPLRYVVEPAPGKSRALAAGIARSRGDVLAFTDDDVLVGDDWLANVRALWRDEHLGIAGGRVLPRWSGPVPRWLRLDNGKGYGRLAAPLALLDYGPTRTPLGRRTVLGANMAVRRRALDAAGGFPFDLGKLRGTLLSGEDHEVCRRVQASGFDGLYDPRLVVRHYVPPDRLRLSYQLRWFFWSGITNASLDRRATDPNAPGVAGTRHWMFRMAKAAARAMVGIARPDVAAEALADIAFALGYLTFSHGWASARVEPARPVRPRVEEA